MLVGKHTIADIHQIDEDLFKKLAHNAHSCIDKENLAKILGVEYNPEHVQLRPGDALLKVLIKGGKLSPFDDELPDNVFLEFYCYNVYSSSTHVITEKELIKMEE
jgi:hypothetical protein